MRETVAVAGSKAGSRRAVLRVRLVGEHVEQRHTLAAELGKITDPELEVSESGAQAAAEDGAAGKSSSNGTGAADGAADVVMVVFDGNEEVSLSYLRGQAEAEPRPVIFALLPERSPSLMRRVLRAGADELLFLPLEAGDATRALLKISEARRKAERRQGGVICSLVSMVGGVGVTSLAANLGLAMRNLLQKRVALVDLDLQSGGLAVFLNLEPERTIIPLAQLQKKPDSIQLEAALTKHDSGLYLLAAPKRIEDADSVSDLTVGAVLDLMRQLFDFVVVDCGRHIDENPVAAWERSQEIFYVLDQSIASARCAWRFIELFERLGIRDAEPSFILNRYAPGRAITDKQIAHTLGRPILARIPRDDNLFERLQLQSQDLWRLAPSSQVARTVEDLARRVAAVSGEKGQFDRPRVVTRLLSLFGAGG